MFPLALSSVISKNRAKDQILNLLYLSRSFVFNVGVLIADCMDDIVELIKLCSKSLALALVRRVARPLLKF